MNLRSRLFKPLLLLLALGAAPLAALAQASFTMSFLPTPVPEPSTFSLVLGALLVGALGHAAAGSAWWRALRRWWAARVRR
jgi:hypothetical protein